MAEKPIISVDIISDVVCPWCAIGYRQLETAVGQFGSRADVQVHWHPFELAPGLPPEGKSLTDYTRERYGSTPEQSIASRDRINAAGKAVGLEFRYTPESRTYSTAKAHQLLMWAGETRGQTALKMALFHAYFTEQLNICDDEVLLNAVESAGLDRSAAAEILADGRYAERVKAEVDYWQDQNVTAVPTYIINGKYMIPGAQDSATFAQVLERIIAKEEAAAA